MFGPNYIFTDEVRIDFTHRDNEFKTLLKSVIDLFVDTFNLYDFDILFIPGSASIGMECIISNLDKPVKVTGRSGTFKNKWNSLCEYYNKLDDSSNIELYCLFETSCSTYNNTTTADYSIIDATSGFPYYNIPDNCAAFVTCLNKQLGSYIGISVVCIKKSCWNLFTHNSIFSYLNLFKYKEYIEQYQTPTTFPMHILQHFEKVLKSFELESFRERINNNSAIIESCCKSVILGNAICPTITIPRQHISSYMCEKYKLYGYDCGRPNIQIFTYSEPDNNYLKFADDLRLNGGIII